MIKPVSRYASLPATALMLLGVFSLVGLAQAATPAPIRLTAEVGPGFNITLKKGKNRVSILKQGSYVITVRDRAIDHNFHLRGPGVNRSTPVAKVVTTTWSVKLRLGTYTYLCDPHANRMRASFQVTR